MRALHLAVPPGAAGAPGAPRSALASATPALLYGVRLSVSVCLALSLAFWLQLDNPHWAATSAAIVAQPALGASLRKGRFRAIGSVIGGVAIIVLTALLPQDRVWFLVSLTLWAALCGYLATILPNFAGYAAALAGYTAAIVFAGITASPEDVFMVTVWRVTEIGIGIVSATLVHALTDFGGAHRRLGPELMQIGKGIASGLGATLRAGEESLGLRTSRRELIARTIELDATIDEVIGESSHLRHQGGRLQRAFEALFVALSGWRGIGNHLGGRTESPPVDGAAELVPTLAKLADRDWLSDPQAIRGLCYDESRRLRQSGAGDLTWRLLVEEAARVLQALGGVADALVAMAREDGQARTPMRSRLYVADFLPACLNALRIVLAIVAAELIWIATSWPRGPVMITFTAVNVLLAARQADAAYAWAVEFGAGCLIGGILAALLDLAILPLVHGGPLVLSLALTLVLLPVGALAAGTWRKTLFVSAAANFMPILALENEPTYDATRLFETALAVGAGCFVAALFIRLLPPLTAERRIQRLLRLSLRDLRALVRGGRRFTKDRWLGLLSARLAAMPKQANLEEEAELLATLSIGEAAIDLSAARRACREPELLDEAFAGLGNGRVAAARESLMQFSVRHSELAVSDGRGMMDPAVQAILIADALQRHERFFATLE